ncbi:MAG: nucleoside triphosphate pyrophosphohydrolase [Pseudomonadota bacterium]
MHDIDELLRIMARLRDPESGCPWDLQQDFHTIVPFTLEEAYEVAHAIETGDFAELRSELGDLLFQVVFYSQMAKERALFDFADVVNGICEKMLRRHPHVFDQDQVHARELDAIKDNWERIKRAEKRVDETSASLMDHLTRALPALTYAAKMQKKAAKVGFDWERPEQVVEKLAEELVEFRAAQQGGDAERIQDELGDLLFTCVNLARHHGLDPEQTLRRANAKFEARFRVMETLIHSSGKQMAAMSLQELEELWQAAKRQKV